MTDPMSPGVFLHEALKSGNTTVQEQTISLPGGVTDSIRNTTAVWSYPNLHGDNITMNRPGFLAAFFLVKGCCYAQELPNRGPR